MNSHSIGISRLRVSTPYVSKGSLITRHQHFLTVGLLTLLIAGSVLAQPKLVAQKVTLKNGKGFDLNLPAEFEIIPAAEGLKRVRFFAKSSDGRIFVTDMQDLTDNKRGKIYILDGFDPATGKFAKTVEYMSGLHNPNSVQFYRDPQGQDWLYIAETGQLTRRKFTKGEEKPTDNNPHVLTTFPDYGLSYKYGGWHLTRTLAFGNNGKLYVSVGSSCNSCIEKEKNRAAIVEMNPDGTQSRIFAKGLRNAVGLRWFGNFLFATNQGSDHLGIAKPDETFYAVKNGADYGWPYCHSSNGRIFADPALKRPGGCRGVPAPYAFFPARSSALGFDFFNDAESPADIKDAFLVSLHGSSDKEMARGYKIVIMRRGERIQEFMTGFLREKIVNGRPCDILKLGPDSFLFTDDHLGVIYLVRKKGSNPTIAQETNLESEPETTPSVNASSEPSNSCSSLAIFCVAALFSSSLLRL